MIRVEMCKLGEAQRRAKLGELIDWYTKPGCAECERSQRSYEQAMRKHARRIAKRSQARQA